MESIQNVKGIECRQLKEFVERCLDRMSYAKKVLVIFPDYTRVDFTHKIAPLIVEKYTAQKGCRIDFLNAGGTHREMSNAEIKAKLGLKNEHGNLFFYNHNFNDKDILRTIGNISKRLVSEKTGGHFNTDIDITVNRRIFYDYDIILVLSSTIPHEAAGYSGGLKIFFPGISGPDVIDLFHWAAVLVGLGSIIGTRDNNSRDLINAGAKIIFDNIKSEVYSFNMVSTEDENGIVPVGLYIDSEFTGFLNCYKAAYEISRNVNIKYINTPLSSVVQQIPEYYDEIWTAAKGSYKLQRPGVLSSGAEVIIYAPHIKILHSNEIMQNEIFSLGYHCRDYVCQKLQEGLAVSRNAASHVINTTGPGTYDAITNKEKKSFKVSLATAISEKDCKKLDLGYIDPNEIKKSDFTGTGKLWIYDGGKYLYELRKRNKKEK